MKVIERDCAVCSAQSTVEVFTQRYDSIVGLGRIDFEQRIVICKDCGFTFCNPSPSAEELGGYYESFSNYEKPQRNGHESEEMLNKWRRTYEIVTKRFPPDFKGSVLEIGCATGAGLSIFKAQGWNVLGVEPSANAAKLAEKLYGIRVVNGFFEPQMVADHAPFDVIVLSHVVEHLLDPQELVQGLPSILSEDGLVYIEVPNLLRPFVPMGYFMFEHLNYFTPTTLKTLMEVSGFDVEIELYDNSADIDPFYPVISALGKIGGGSEPRSGRMTLTQRMRPCRNTGKPPNMRSVRSFQNWTRSPLTQERVDLQFGAAAFTRRYC